MPFHPLQTRSLAILIALAIPAAQAQIQSDPAIPPTILHRSKPRAPKLLRPSLNPNLIVLDPAHGGADEGSRLDGNLLEKDTTLAFSNRLRTLLIARGFTVVTTHESASDDLAPDGRVEVANRAHPLACLILHAAGTGHGVHLFASSLAPRTPQESSSAADAPILSWDTAQASSLAQSLRLASDLSTALNGVRIPLVLGQVSVRPIDSITAPSLALELAPLSLGTAQTSPADPGYQQRVAEAITSGLTLWRGHVQSQLAAAEAERNAAATPAPNANASPRSKPGKPPATVPQAPIPSRRPAKNVAPIQ